MTAPPKYFAPRHLVRLKDMIAYLEQRIAVDEKHGHRPHRKIADRSVLVGMLDSAQHLMKVYAAAERLLEVLDTFECDEHLIGECDGTCLAGRINAAADELDEVLP